MALLDVRTLPVQTRHAAAERIRTAADFDLPALDWFNTDPCERHPSIEAGAAAIPPCRRCGIRFRRHQRIGVAWLYMRGRGLVADQVGTGKTAQAAGLLAAIKQAGELEHRRAVVIVRPSVLEQWVAELHRFVPKLVIATATGTRAKRIATYCAGWDVLVTGYQMFVRDAEMYTHLPVGVVIVDDVDALRNPSNSTAYAIKRLSRRAERAVVLTATPLQKRLPELHSVLEPVGSLEVFGSATAFRRTYVREDLVRVYSPNAGRHVQMREVTGYQNLDDFRAKLTPMVLRRTAEDIDDVDLPVIHPPNNVWLDLHPAQAARYDELRAGVLKIIKAEGAQVRHAAAAAKFLYGQQICAGLATLGEPDGPGSSSKLDWVMRVLTGDLEAEKVVVFCQFTNTVQALAGRLTDARVGHGIIWGREQDRAARQRATARFWDDPACRVLIGTSAIEQGLNLQVSRHLICVDQLMNPARMTQLAGRIRRDGSAYRTVYVHNLLARGTQEAGYLDLLSREQALADHVWDEQSDLYAALSPLALLQLIGSSGGRRP